LNHVNIALGSVAELETQIEIAVRQGYVSRVQTSHLHDELNRVGQMLRRLQQGLEARKRRELGLAITFVLGGILLLL
jgi:four helix bundle protein